MYELKRNNILEKHHDILKHIKRDKFLLAMIALPIIYFIIFKILPIAGNIVAFRKYLPGKSIFGIAWAGTEYFKLFIQDQTFWHVFKNNIILSLLTLVIGFPIPIIFALLLNEIRSTTFKRLTQTISYLPKFFSTVVVVGILLDILSPSSGFVNSILKMLGQEPIFFTTEPSWFRTIYIASDVWQFTGWNAIIYLAALAGVDAELYDAAAIDGANRFKQIMSVTLPSISGTIIIVFILSVGYILEVGFEKILLLDNPVIRDTSDVISTYVYRLGLVEFNYSYATAIGLFNSVIGFTLIYISNKLARKYSDASLW